LTEIFKVVFNKDIKASEQYKTIKIKKKNFNKFGSAGCIVLIGGTMVRKYCR
jgi:hypothetical protein